MAQLREKEQVFVVQLDFLTFEKVKVMFQQEEVFQNRISESVEIVPDSVLDLPWPLKMQSTLPLRPAFRS